MSLERFRNSTYSKYFEFADVDVVKWARNVYNKVKQNGILPKFVDRIRDISERNGTVTLHTLSDNRDFTYEKGVDTVTGGVITIPQLNIGSKHTIRFEINPKSFITGSSIIGQVGEGRISIDEDGTFRYNNGSAEVSFLTGMTSGSSAWSLLSSYIGTQIPSYAYDVASFNIGNYAYFGICLSGEEYTRWFRLNTVDETWAETSTLPFDTTYNASVFVINGEAYLGPFSGWTAGTPFYKYSPDTNTWTELIHMLPFDKWFASSFVYNGFGYVVGGFRGISIGSVYTTKDDEKVFKYDPNTNTFTEVNSFVGVALNESSGGQVYIYNLVIGDRVYLIRQTEQVLWQYNPATDTYAQLANIPTDLVGREDKRDFVATVFEREGDLFAITKKWTGIKAYHYTVIKYSVAINSWSFVEKLPFALPSIYTFTSLNINGDIFFTPDKANTYKYSSIIPNRLFKVKVEREDSSVSLYINGVQVETAKTLATNQSLLFTRILDGNVGEVSNLKITRDNTILAWWKLNGIYSAMVYDEGVNSEDFYTFWYSICYALALQNRYTHFITRVDDSDLLMHRFLNSKGILLSGDETVEEIVFLYNNWVDEFRKRGTEQVAYSKNQIRGLCLDPANQTVQFVTYDEVFLGNRYAVEFDYRKGVRFAVGGNDVDILGNTNPLNITSSSGSLVELSDAVGVTMKFFGDQDYVIDDNNIHRVKIIRNLQDYYVFVDGVSVISAIGVLSSDVDRISYVSRGTVGRLGNIRIYGVGGENVNIFTTNEQAFLNALVTDTNFTYSKYLLDYPNELERPVSIGSNHTVEFEYTLTGISGTPTVLQSASGDGIRIEPSGMDYVVSYRIGSGVATSPATSLPATGEVKVVRDGSAVGFFVDGLSIGSASLASNATSSLIFVRLATNGLGIGNVRVTEGSVLTHQWKLDSIYDSGGTVDLRISCAEDGYILNDRNGNPVAYYSAGIGQVSTDLIYSSDDLFNNYLRFNFAGGELTRVINKQEPDEFIYPLLANTDLAWNLGTGSPSSIQTYPIIGFNKFVGYGKNIPSLKDMHLKFPEVGVNKDFSRININTTRFVGRKVIELNIDENKSGGIEFAKTGDMVFNRRLIPVNSDMDYEVSFRIYFESTNPIATSIDFNMDFGVDSFDDVFTETVLLSDADGTDSNTIATVTPDVGLGGMFQSRFYKKWVLVRGVIYNSEHTDVDERILSIPSSHNLRLKEDTFYIYPRLSITPLEADCRFYLTDIGVRPLVMNTSKGTQNVRNVILPHIINRGQKTFEAVETTIKTTLAPYNALVLARDLRVRAIRSVTPAPVDAIQFMDGDYMQFGDGNGEYITFMI